jgi:hypothetical protein
LPAPYTGRKHLTKKTENDHEAAAWTERFLAMIAQATGRSTALNELIRLDSLIAPDSAFGGCLSRELTQRAPAVLRRFLKMLDLPVPVAKGAGEPVIFESMIRRWAKYTNAPKKGRQDMETKCGRFVYAFDNEPDRIPSDPMSASSSIAARATNVRGSPTRNARASWPWRVSAKIPLSSGATYSPPMAVSGAMNSPPPTAAISSVSTGVG